MSSSTSQTVTGALSGRQILLPNVDVAPIPAIVPPGVIYNGEPAQNFGEIESDPGLPDQLSYRRKFALLAPATNTTMEHDLWNILHRNNTPDSLGGIGIHASPVLTPRPAVATDDEIAEYGRAFVAGLNSAVDVALLAEPHYMIMGMSLEHVIFGLDKIRAPVPAVEAHAGLSMSVWHDAAQSALNVVGAKRIGLLTPFNDAGNLSATRMFEELGFDVVASVGLSCANTVHIAHLPEWAKEKAVTEYLATPENRLDAVVQCGTNMSVLALTEKLEPKLGIPILGINSVLLWHALRETAITSRAHGAGMLMRDH
jgi:maleate isomerase